MDTDKRPAAAPCFLSVIVRAIPWSMFGSGRGDRRADGVEATAGDVVDGAEFVGSDFEMPAAAGEDPCVGPGGDDLGDEEIVVSLVAGVVVVAEDAALQPRDAAGHERGGDPLRGEGG